MKTLFSLIATALVLIPLSAVAEQKKLKVFILAGQSNMEGHAKVETFDSLAHDPATASLHKLMHGEDGKPAVADNVWISYLTGKMISEKLTEEEREALTAPACFALVIISPISFLCCSTGMSAQSFMPRLMETTSKPFPPGVTLTDRVRSKIETR